MFDFVSYRREIHHLCSTAQEDVWYRVLQRHQLRHHHRRHCLFVSLLILMVLVVLVVKALLVAVLVVIRKKNGVGNICTSGGPVVATSPTRTVPVFGWKAFLEVMS